VIKTIPGKQQFPLYIPQTLYNCINTTHKEIWQHRG